MKILNFLCKETSLKNWSLMVSAIITLMIINQAHAFLINKDVKQTFVDPQDNYEIELEGDWRGITSGVTINPFANGQVQESYNGSTTTVSFSGDAIPKSNQNHHFGVGAGIPKNHGKIKREYWTRGNVATDTPGCSTGYYWDQNNSTVMVVHSNDTDDPIIVNQTATWTFENPVGLEMLDMEDLPPDSGTPTEIAPGIVLAPGESAWTIIPGVTPGTQVVTFVGIQYAEPQPGAYDATVGIWMGWTAGEGVQ